MPTTDNKPQIGVSACLMGKPVRFDGGHKQNRFVLDQCTQYFDMHAVCPEAELGLGVPRPVIQLRSFDDEVKLVFSKKPDSELTFEMREFSVKRIQAMPVLDGFIFKKDSPSCGMERVPVFDNKTGMRQRNGTGVFAQAFKNKHPDVPMEEEGRLTDMHIRENFLERVYAHYRWRQLDNAEHKLHAFREYHKKYKLVLLAKNPVAYRELGQLAASANKKNHTDIMPIYFTKFMQVMATIPSRGNHVSALMHILGYLKYKLDSQDKAELLKWFEIYRIKQVARITPMVLLQHHFQHHPNDYIAKQYYFSPFPSDLMHAV